MVHTLGNARCVAMGICRSTAQHNCSARNAYAQKVPSNYRSLSLKIAHGRGVHTAVEAAHVGDAGYRDVRNSLRKTIRACLDPVTGGEGACVRGCRRVFTACDSSSGCEGLVICDGAFKNHSAFRDSVSNGLLQALHDDLHRGGARAADLRLEEELRNELQDAARRELSVPLTIHRESRTAGCTCAHHVSTGLGG